MRLDLLKAVSGLRIDRGVISQIFRYGFPMFFWFLGSQVLGVSDRFLLEYFRGAGDVGLYASNYNLMLSSIGLLTSPVLLAAQTNIMGHWSRGEKLQTHAVVTSTAFFYLLATIPIFLITVLYSAEIVNIALGAAFRAAHLVIPIVFFGFMLNGFSLFVQKSYELEKRTRTIAAFIIIAATVNVVLNLFFIPAYGYLGAAVTTAIAYSLYLLLVSTGAGTAWRFAYPWPSMAKLVAANVCTFVFLLWLKVYFHINPQLQLLVSLVAAYALSLGILFVIKEKHTMNALIFIRSTKYLRRKYINP